MRRSFCTFCPFCTLQATDYDRLKDFVAEYKNRADRTDQLELQVKEYEAQLQELGNVKQV